MCDTEYCKYTVSFTVHHSQYAVTVVEAAAAEIERESLMQHILHDWIIYWFICQRKLVGSYENH